MTRKSWPFLSTYQERSAEQQMAIPSAEASGPSNQNTISLGIERVCVGSSPMSNAPLRCSDFGSGNLLPSAA